MSAGESGWNGQYWFHFHEKALGGAVSPFRPQIKTILQHKVDKHIDVEVQF